MEAAENVPAQRVRSLRLLSSAETPNILDLPITSLVYDPLSEFFFVGAGFVQGTLGKLFGGEKVRGTVSMFTAHERMPLEVLRFSMGVISLAWDLPRRCLFVGLATGHIVFFGLSTSTPYQLTYLGELSFHPSPLCMICIDSAQSRVYSASTSGSIECYNIAEGSTVGQGTAKSNNNKNAQVTAATVIVDRAWLLCGTSHGSLLVYDVNHSPAKLLKELEVVAPGQNATAVQALWYEEDTQLLYVAAGNAVLILNVPSSPNDFSAKMWDYSEPLQLKPTVQITQLLVLLGGDYVVVSCGGDGTVAIFAMTEKVYGKVGGATAESEEIITSTSAAQILPWQKAALLPTAALRIWFQSKGVNASDALTRRDLLALLVKTCKIQKKELAEVLRPKNPVKDVMLMYTLNPCKDSRAYITSLSYFDSMRAIACGCVDGSVQLLSLADFLPTEPATEESIRRRAVAVALKAYEEAESPPKGSKSTKGKRLQM